MPQRDEAPSIQQFFFWVDGERKYSRISPDSDERIPFNSIPPIEAYFKEKNHERLNAILMALFESDPPPGIAEVIVEAYVAVFCILVYIGKGRHIQNFIEYDLNDQHLPFDPSHRPPGFPCSSDERFFEKFCQKQWRFCCTIFRRVGLFDRKFYAKQILPIADKQQLGKGASAVLYKIRIHGEYNDLHPQHVKSELTPEHANTFVLKTYISNDAEKVYTNEVAAFRRLTGCKNVIGYYGNFVHGGTRHILLEYADKGDLERYLQTVPPSNGEDILSFWKGMFNIVMALMNIHTTRLLTAPVFQGLHQDVKPQNILVLSKENALPYKWQFKLGDFGLSQFKKLTSLQGRTTLDAQGTRTYGAPECYRDELLAAAQLEVTPKADIWSLGCIYSEAARWVATGATGLDNYREDRLSETQRIPNFGDGSCFHNGVKILQSVCDSHKATIDNLHGEDTITKLVLEMIVVDMLDFDPRNRPEAQKLWIKTQRILSDAQDVLRRLNNKPTASRPRPPSVLPPILRRSTFPAVRPLRPSSSRTGSLDSPFLRPKKKLKPKTRPSYCFSADARSLFLWAKDAEKIAIYDVTSETPKSFNAIDVHLAAGGEKLYAIVSETGNHGNLHIHQVIDGTLVVSIRIEFLVASIALSRNDEFLALGTVGKVVVYNTRQPSQSWTHVLPPTEGRESPCERVWFSADSDKVLAARRNMNGDVCVYVSNCKNPTTNFNIPHINNPHGHYQDYGVSSILYDNKYACVTAYGSKMPPCLFSLQGNPQRHNLDSRDYRKLGTQIQSATSHPNSERPEFVLVNSVNNIFSVQQLSSGQWQVKKLCKLSLDDSFRQDEMTIIAMPTQNTINAFRIQGRKMILTTLTISNDKSARDVSKFPRDIAAKLAI